MNNGPNVFKKEGGRGGYNGNYPYNNYINNGEEMDFSSLEGSSNKQANADAFDDISSIHSQQNIGGTPSIPEK